MDCELLAPAGDFDTAIAAFDAGADAVYCGLGDFSARAFAQNFTLDEMSRLVKFSRSIGRRVYVTFNTLVDERDMGRAMEELAALEELKADGVIVQDIGVAALCRRLFPSLKLHASTQMFAHNLEGVVALKDLGFSRVVLARELSIDEISSIARRCGGMELEVFVHGALCYSISGLCLFSAMEKGRSGNRGKCAYCCRMPHADGAGAKRLPFSMRDLRVGEDAPRLAAAGVKSLKIEGRMKSALYVASVVSHYRDILDGRPPRVSVEDLESVFSRNTTKLRLFGDGSQPTDPDSPLGHLGTPIGVVKKVTADREGLKWLRFHSARALEKHDGLQFCIPRRPPPNEKAAQWTFAGTAMEKVGFGITELRTAMSRSSVFETPADCDVEVLLPDGFEVSPGDRVYCSMSNAVKRMFPKKTPRESDLAGLERLDVKVVFTPSSISANGVKLECSLERAKDPSRTHDAVRKAFSRLGGTEYFLGDVEIDDGGLFAPPGLLNELRRKLVEATDGLRREARAKKLAAAAESMEAVRDGLVGGGRGEPRRRLKVREGQKVPPGEWDEVIVAVDVQRKSHDLPPPSQSVRLAVPLWNGEMGYNAMRTSVKRLVRDGYVRWECTDLATLRTLKAIGVEDISADWTLYAFNAEAVAQLKALGVRRFVASPENSPANLEFLSSLDCEVEALVQQSTPLFISLNEPGCAVADGDIRVYRRDGLYIAERRAPRVFEAPDGASVRVDLSWDAPEET